MLNRLGVWIIITLFSALILWRHDALSLWAATGSIANVVLSYSLKGILNHKRPIPNLRSDPGMPSSHSQFMFFIVVFATLSIFKWLGVNKVSLALGVLLLTMGGYFSWLRVAHQLHTLSQVIVGAAVGSVFCVLWNWSWTTFASKAFSSLLWVRILVSLGALSYIGTITWNFIRAWYLQEDL